MTEIGDLLVRAPAVDLTVDELRARHEAIQNNFRIDPDAERAYLQMAWLCLLAIEVVRQHMGESHVDTDPRGSDRNSRAVPVPDAFWRAPQHTIGGGWRAAGPAATSRPR